jgi:hypothetical protein
MKLLFLLLGLFSFYSATAQNNTVLTNAEAEQNAKIAGGGSGANPLTAMFRTFDGRYQGVKGHPYFINQWLKGTLVSKKGKKTDYLIKFCNYTDDVYTRSSETSDSLLANKTLISEFTITDEAGKTYLFRKLPPNLLPHNKKEFFQVLYESEKYKVLALRKKNVVKADYKDPYSSGKPYDLITDYSEVFLQKSDQTIQEIKGGQKAVIKLIGADADKLKEFIKQNDLKVKEEADLVRLIEYASGL